MSSGPNAAGLPVVDISDARAAEQIRDAAVTHGFFYVTNHGVPAELIERQFQQSQAFFALSDEEKNAIAANAKARGYTSKTYQTIDPKGSTEPDRFEGFWAWIPEIKDGEPGSELPYAGPNVWPSAELVPGFRETMTEYMQAAEIMSKRVIKLVAQALELPQDYFDPFFRSAQNQMRAIHYLAGASDPERGVFGVGAHSDWGFVTFLTHDGTPGLQLKVNGTWLDVEPVPNAYVVNLGDMLQFWSNGRFRSTQHRVVKPDKERYSCAFFVGPSPDAKIECLPTCRNGKASFEPITVSEYLTMKYQQLAAEKPQAPPGES